MQLFKQLITPDIITDVLCLYSASDNDVMIDGEHRDRHNVGEIGKFMLSEFTITELQFLWDYIKDNLGASYDFVYGRVLKYTSGCYIPSHVDTKHSGQQGDTSLIIQLNSLDSFSGGIPSVHGKKIYIVPGDAMLVDYGETHEVSPVHNGIRYVVNLRLRKNNVS